MSDAAQTKDGDGTRAQRPGWTVPMEALCKSRELAGGPGPSDEHVAIAKFALDQFGVFDSHAPFQAALLARELWFHLRHLLGRVWEQKFDGANDLDMLPADAFALDYIERLGNEGAVAAESMRKSARTRWATPSDDVESRNYLWRNWHRTDFRPTSMSIAGALACVLWQDVVEPKLKRAPCPAVSTSVLEAATTTLFNQHAKSVWVHRVFRWLVSAAYVDSLSSAPCGDIVATGGLSRLAKEMGDIGGNARDDVRRVLDLMQTTCTAPGKQPWLTFSTRPSAPGRPALVRIRPHDALYPNYVPALPNRSQSQRLAKTLVPVPQNLPPHCGRKNEHGPQCTLELLVLRYFRRNARSLATHGSLCLSDAEWEEMALEANLSPAATPALVEAWTCDGKSRDGLLWRRGENLYAFGPAWRTPAMLVVQGAQQQLVGAKVQAHRRRFASKI